MGNLPNSRTITLGPDDPVPSALLNELQDAIVAIDPFLDSATGVVTALSLHYTQQETIKIPAACAEPEATGPQGAYVAIGSSRGWALGTTSAGGLVYPITLRYGERIKSWLLFLNKQSATGTITAKLYRSPSILASGEVQIGATQSNAAAAPGNITLGQTGLDEAATTDATYYVIVNGGGTNGDVVTDLQVNVTKP